jgi:hypothetical protein
VKLSVITNFVVSLFFVGNVFGAVDVKTYIPTNAYTYLPALKVEQLRFWNDHPAPELLGSLIDHETCYVSQKNATCWLPTARLKSQREEGAGFGQITRAYDKNGKIRFDALQELKDKHPSVLSGWSWENVYNKPDLQLRSVVLKSKDDFNYLKFINDPKERLNFADAAYNGGMGGVQSDRRACGLKAGCDPQIWFGNVELTCTKSKSAIYDTRSPCFINRNHVNDVINIRSVKYKPYLQNIVVFDKPVVKGVEAVAVKKSYFTLLVEFVLNIFK